MTREDIEYINSHIGFFTLLSTFIISSVSFAIKAIRYAYICGEYSYWNINNININILSPNFMYDLLLYGSFSIIYLFLNINLTIILLSENPNFKKGIQTLCMLISSAMFITYLTIGPPTFPQIIFIFILILFIYAPGFAWAFIFRKKKSDYGKIEKIKLLRLLSPHALLFFVILITVYSILFYYMGISNAKSQKSFKLVGDNYAVIYENTEDFIISKCIDKGETIEIYINTQKHIKKVNVETQFKSFDKVEIKPKK